MRSPEKQNQHSPNEQARLLALRKYDSFSYTGEESLLNLIQLIAEDFSMPLAAVTFIGEHDVTVVASTGFRGATTFDRHKSICSLAVLSDEINVFRNIKTDPLLNDYSIGHGAHDLKFYAAAPLVTSEGFRIGGVCVGDEASRQFTEEDRQRLRRFSMSIMHELDLLATIRRRTAKLEEREQQLKQAFRLARIGSWEYNVATHEATWSDELYEIFGIENRLPPHQLVETYLSLIHPDDKKEAMAKLAHPESVPDSSTERLLLSDGRTVCLQQVKIDVYNEQGILTKIIGISQDITERIAYEERLRESEERFKALVQNSSDMIAILDAAGNLRYISPSSTAISGYTPEELIHHNVFDFIHPADRKLLTAELAKVVVNNDSGEPTLHRFRAKSGQWIWLESVGTNKMNDAHIDGIIVNARNVTERIHLEEKLAIEQQNNQRSITSAVIEAQETERSELGRELHDNVNQVLTTVKLYTELIHDGIGDQKELVERSTKHLQDCIDEIRSISKRLSAPTLGDIGLDDSIKELVDSINLTNRIEITYCGTHMAGIKIPQELHLGVFRIIQETLNNILKYASASIVNITLVREERYLFLSINDNGKGFDLAAKRSGIGITNMRTRAENLGGSFELTSEKGKGSRLQVRLPLAQTASHLPDAGQAE